MLLSSLGLGATFALAATGFLIPPSVSTEDIEKTAIQAAAEHITPRRSEIDLRCPECNVWAQFDLPSSGPEFLDPALTLEFSVNDDTKTVLLNDVPFYPPNLAEVSPLTASVAGIDPWGRKHDLTTRNERLSYALKFQDMVRDDEDNKLITIDLQIIAWGDRPVTVDPVSLRVVQTAGGSLKIVDVKTVPALASPTEGESVHEQKDCRRLPSMLCKWIALIKAKMQAMKTSFRQSHGFRRPNCTKWLKNHPRPYGGPHPANGIVPPNMPEGGKVWTGKPYPQYNGGMRHHGHHRHSRLHGFVHALHRIAVTIFVPILIGVAAGMAASVLGMVTGTLIGYLWIRFRRGGRRGPGVAVLDEDGEEAILRQPTFFRDWIAAVKARAARGRVANSTVDVEREQADVEEKEGLIARGHVEQAAVAPPAYEESFVERKV